jgi:hypothetical protein
MTADEEVPHTVGGCKVVEQQVLMPFSGDHAVALDPEHAADWAQVAVEFHLERYRVQLVAQETEETVSYGTGWGQDNERLRKAAHIATPMHLAIGHKNSDGQVAAEHCMAEALSFGPNTVGSKIGATDSVEVTMFGRIAG